MNYLQFSLRIRNLFLAYQYMKAINIHWNWWKQNRNKKTDTHTKYTSGLFAEILCVCNSFNIIIKKINHCWRCNSNRIKEFTFREFTNTNRNVRIRLDWKTNKKNFVNVDWNFYRTDNNCWWKCSPKNERKIRLQSPLWIHIFVFLCENECHKIKKAGYSNSGLIRFCVLPGYL